MCIRDSIYGISPYGLAKQLSVSNSEGKQYINDYFNRFPKIKEYMDSLSNESNYNNTSIFFLICSGL